MHVNSPYAPPNIQRAAGQAHNCGMAKKARHRTFLREWRKAKPGRTLEQVAHHLSMSQPQLGRIERGDQPYNQDLLEALAALYGCTVPDLLIRDPSQPTNMWSLWDEARPGVRRQIEQVAAALVRTGTDG